MSRGQGHDFRIGFDEYSNGTVRLINRLTGKERAVFEFPDWEKVMRGNMISLSPDARYACVGTDRSLYLLRLPDPPAANEEPGRPDEVQRFRWEVPAIYNIDLSPDGRLLLAGGG